MRTAYFGVLFCLALAGVMAYLSMAILHSFEVGPFVKVTVGLLVLLGFAESWRRSLEASGQSRAIPALIAFLSGLGLCGASVALATKHYPSAKGRPSFLSAMLELLGDWPAVLLLLLAGLLVIWGTYSALSERET